ncbi:MAG: response regulator [Candidatus Margulisbacteria bacterium]|nr:response regulator [Candidatus Margulisiibacteriota bacterium]
MASQLILLISSDSAATGSLQEILGGQYKFEIASDNPSAVSLLQNQEPDLVFIDHDLKSGDAMHIFHDVQALRTDVNVIMFSAQNNIPLAVAAAKAGVAEFLQKPFQAEQVKETVSRNLAKKEIRLVIPQNADWLAGESPARQELLDSLRQAIFTNADAVVFAERGIDKNSTAEIIHNSGPRKKRKLVSLDLSAFKKEAQEASFWTLLQEIMALPDSNSVVEEKDRCGTIFFDRVEQAEAHFRQALVSFLKDRRSKIDKSIRVVFGIKSDGIESIQEIDKFIKIALPPLKVRKEDLPFILERFVSRYSGQYNKSVGGISFELLNLLVNYDFPGNYRELEKIVQSAVLAATGDKLELKDLPLDFIALLKIELKELADRELSLSMAKREFEGKLYKLLLDKMQGDDGKVARFLDIPRSTLNQRIEDLQV